MILSIYHPENPALSDDNDDLNSRSEDIENTVIVSGQLRKRKHNSDTESYMSIDGTSK
jgi:hypothetical protein